MALKQMLLTISRLNKLGAASQAHAELGMMDDTTASYMAMIQRGERPQPHTARADRNGDNDDDHGPEPGPKSLSSVELACAPGMFIYIHGSIHVA